MFCWYKLNLQPKFFACNGENTFEKFKKKENCSSKIRDNFLKFRYCC